MLMQYHYLTHPMIKFCQVSQYCLLANCCCSVTKSCPESSITEVILKSISYLRIYIDCILGVTHNAQSQLSLCCSSCYTDLHLQDRSLMSNGVRERTHIHTCVHSLTHRTTELTKRQKRKSKYYIQPS